MNENSFVAVTQRASDFRRARLAAAVIALVLMLLMAAGHADAARFNAIPPGARFITPLNGSVVQGVQSVVVSAPEYSQYYAEFGVDGGKWQPLQHQGDGIFNAKWNSGQVPNGRHTLTARLSLGPGKVPIYSVSIRVYVQNIDS